MTGHGVVGLVAMHVDRQTAIRSDAAQGFDRSGPSLMVRS